MIYYALTFRSFVQAMEIRLPLKCTHTVGIELSRERTFQHKERKRTFETQRPEKDQQKSAQITFRLKLLRGSRF
jgi:hypothetical protein